MNPRTADLLGVAGSLVAFHSLGMSCYRLTLPFTISYFEQVLSKNFGMLSFIESLVALALGKAARRGDQHSRRIGLFVIVLSILALPLSTLGTFHGVYDKYHPSIYEKL